MIVFEKFQSAPAAEPAGRALRARGADRALHHGRRRWRGPRRRSIRFGAWSRPMSWPPSACTATTRPCRCWPKARPTPAGSGSTSATMSRSARPGRRPPRSPRATARRASPGASRGYAGILQADAYGSCNKLYLADRKPSPIREAAYWAHARRKFFVLADIEENTRRKAGGKSEIPALCSIAIEGRAPHRRAV